MVSSLSCTPFRLVDVPKPIMEKLVNRPCPVCDASERKVMHRQVFVEGPMGDGYEVVVCENCGAAFSDKIPEQSAMDRYYAEQSKYAQNDSGGSETLWDTARFNGIFQQLKPCLDSKGVRILDIGCATGGLLSIFKANGYDNLLGLDPSAECAVTAKALHGIDVRATPISKMADWDEQFDLILMIGVLEHLREVKPAVRLAKSMLSSGGRLYCAVPDVEGLAECANAPYQQFSVEHVNFFSAESLNRLMADCEMGLVHSQRTVVEWREGVFEPVIGGLYAAFPGVRDYFARDCVSQPALERYLRFSELGEKPGKMLMMGTYYTLRCGGLYCIFYFWIKPFAM